MKLLDARTSIDFVKLVIFIVVTSLATGLLAVVIGNLTFGPSREYSAVFSDATGVVEGDDVRIAGVKVGTVEEIEIVERTRARVTFSVDEEATLTGGTNATIRYRNLVGQRYIALEQEIGDAERLEAGSTIPIDRTSPALDLTVLFNGFKPLFQALSPSDVNKLSYEIIQVFQGEGGTLESLLGHTASLTGTLADRDRLVGDLIENLNQTLATIGDRDQELSELIITFKRLVKGLKQDRQAILTSLDGISELSEETAQLVDEAREPLVKDIRELRRFAGNLDENKAEIDRALQVLPIKLEKVGRTAIYGSWFNFYLCEFKGTVRLPIINERLDVEYPFPGTKISDRCELG